MSNQQEVGFATLAIHSGERPNYSEGSTGDVVSPIHLSTTFVWHDPSRLVSEFDYSRSGNPTRKAYETKLAAIEKGAYGLAFASGMAAESAVLQALTKPTDHIIGFDDLYGGTRRLIEKVYTGLQISYVDLTRIEAFEASITPNTRIVWIESPTNPLIKVCDIQAISEIAHKHNILVVVDNTFLSPYFQNPLTLGADVVVHSTTKYIGGHSDVLGGAIVVNDPDLYEKLKGIQNNVGAVLSPFDSYLNMRGIKTLAVRMEQHQRNALAIAQYLKNHKQVKKVLYPGLPDHPQYEISKKQSTGFGGMLSFELHGDIESTKKVLGRFKIFSVAESLGGVESLVELPAYMTHVHVDKAIRESIGITDTFVRMSVGIENVEDLIADIEQALGDKS